jgi:probable FeS assembly SUF system protein SufT
MPSPDQTELVRDCIAVQIPHGSSVTLPKGTAFDITQTLGGSYTIRTPEGLFRIGSENADALGVSPGAPSPEQGSPTNATAADTGNTQSADVTEEQIWDTLRTCYDPEIPVNIVDLGLVYEMGLRALPSGQRRVDVKMTLTAPGCGMGGVIAGDAQQKLLMLDGVEEAIVEIVWDPPWHQSRITAEGRRVLGLE